MDSFKFHDIKAEKASATSRYSRIQRIITTLFRFLEVFVFLIVVSRFSTQFALSLKLSGEWLSVTLVSPRSVFLVGNVIVLALFLISGKVSSRSGESSTGFYDEYVEKCRINNRQSCTKSEKIKSPDLYRKYSAVNNDERKAMSRSQSEIMIEKSVNGESGAEFYDEYVEKCRINNNLQKNCAKPEKIRAPDVYRKKYNAVCIDERKIMSRSQSEITTGMAVRGEERSGDLSRSMSESRADDEMSGEEFRRTVEAFIARQQRVLWEEEELSSAVVSREIA